MVLFLLIFVLGEIQVHVTDFLADFPDLFGLYVSFLVRDDMGVTKIRSGLTSSMTWRSRSLAGLICC